jgi:RimJ/RimL family protein N-acetyltransferase
MTLTFRGVSLRPVLEADLPFLFRLFSDPDRSHLWMRCRSIYDEACFQQAWGTWTSGTIAAKFMIESAGGPAGLVFDYERAPEDGYTKVTTVLDEASIGHGVGATATVLFWEWLFQSLPLRKVYMDVSGYNQAVVRMLRKVELAEEGILKADRYWNGAYWDLHIFALYREAFPKVRERVLRLPRAKHADTVAQSASPGKEVSSTENRILTNGCPSGTD